MSKDPLIKKLKVTATSISQNAISSEQLLALLREEAKKEGILDSIQSFDITVDVTCTLNKKTKVKKKHRVKGNQIPPAKLEEKSTLARWVLHTNAKSQ